MYRWAKQFVQEYENLVEKGGSGIVVGNPGDKNMDEQIVYQWRISNDEVSYYTVGVADL